MVQINDDKASVHSVHSTSSYATTTYTTRTIAGTDYTSLSARIATLTLHKEESDSVSDSGTIRTDIGHHDPAFFHDPAYDKATGLEEDAEGTAGEGAYEEEEEEEEEEEVVEVTEEEMIKLLDRDRDPFTVCSALFSPAAVALLYGEEEEEEGAAEEGATAERPEFKVLSEAHVRHLVAKGYVVLDGAFGLSRAQELRTAAREAFDQGLMIPANTIGLESDQHHFTDRTARSDSILFLSPGPDAAISEAAALVRTRLPQTLGYMHELREDLEKVVALQRGETELQLASYPGSGAHYVRHRDALPDDGSEAEQRRVTCIVYANDEWVEEDGGWLRLWAPTAEDAYSDSPLLSDNASCACHSASSQGVRWEAVSPENASPEPRMSSAAHAPSVSRSGRTSTTSEGLFPHAREASQSQDGAEHERYDMVSRGGPGSLHETEPARAPRRFVDIAPLAGRTVVFLSGCVDHEVRPSSSFRVALTAWLQ